MKYINNLLLKLLHKIPPELSHTITIKLLSNILYPQIFIKSYKNLNVSLGNINFKHPIGLAAGFDKNAEVFHKIDKLGLSHVEIGTITPKYQAGNSKPRVFRLHQDNAIINRLGFPSNGLPYIHKRLKKYKSHIPLGINIGCNKETTDYISDYLELTKNLGHYANWLTINISSPNTPRLRNLQTSNMLSKLLQTIDNERKTIENKRGSSLQVWLKIAPDLSDTELKKIIDTAIDNNIDALCISNTTIRRPNNLISKKKLENGGLSGKPLFYQSTLMLAKAYLHAQNKIKFIGIGGIDSGETAYLKILAGATILQMYTGLVYNGPELINKINIELSTKIGNKSLSKLVGSKSYEIANGDYLND
mgnify:CR=1 FL=1